jgi:signal transduction histidine kinase/ActR/RegA family two-component response regulator
MDRLFSIQRFRPRLTLLVLLLVFPAFGLVLYANFAQRRAQAAAVRDNTRALSELAAANQEDIVKGARQLLGTLTQFPFLVLTTNRQSSEWHFSNLLKLSPDYVNFGLLETNGDLFCNGAATNAVANLSDRSYFTRAVQGKSFAIGDFQIGRLTKEPSLNFGYPVADEHGEFARVLFSSLKLSRLSEAISHIGLPAGVTILILDRNGMVLAQQPNPGAWVGKSLADTSVVQRILRQEEPIFAMRSIDGVTRLHAITPISDGQAPSLFVCVSIPLSVSMAQANRTLFWNCIMLGLVAIAVLVGGLFYSQRYFLRPVAALEDAANALAAGDLRARTGPISGATELVQLGAAFNEMAQKLEDRQAELLRLNENLRGEILERQRAEQQVREQAEEQRKLEAQLLRSQRMESLGALAGGIAHDLNNALAPIIMGSDILREAAKGDPEDLGFLDLITTSAHRCTQMVKQIVNFAKGSRSQTGSIQLPLLIREMTKIASDTFPKGITIESHSATDLFSVWGDATELHQVLMNLCVNARDAMPQGGRLSIKAQNIVLSAEQVKQQPAASSGRYVLLTVGDTGSGIPDEILARIFEPFFTTKTPEKGTGLGLSTVAEIIKKHKGFIEVESQLGKGTTFKIFLPAEQLKPTEEARPTPSQLPFGKGELILVVDDEEMILELAKTTLENYDYSVVTACNGLEAIGCFEARKEEIKLVLTDTDMPVSDGLQVLQAIQRIKPQIPIIVASGAQRDTQWFSRIETTRLTVLPKPYGVEQLLVAVGALLDGHPTPVSSTTQAVAR